MLAHTPPNWVYLHERLDEMAALSNKLLRVPKDVKKLLKEEGRYDEVHDQLKYLHTNLVRMAENFANGMNLKTDKK